MRLCTKYQLNQQIFVTYIMLIVGITGGTGLVGKHLYKMLADSGYEVVIFTRSPDKQQDRQNITYASWNPSKNEINTTILAKLDAVVHLAGAGIADKRWTDERKKVIVKSRVDSTTFLVEQLKKHAPDCKTFISASAIGFYGEDDGKEPFQEDAPPEDDFLGRTCLQWEEASGAAEEFARRVLLRFGIVLAKEGGAFKEFYKPQKFGVMPILGSGRQIVSWIHVKDVAGIIKYAIEQENVSGVYNTVAPTPVTHSKLMHTIGKIKGGISIPVPVPAFALKLMLGEMSIEILKSCTVSSKKIENAGYSFKYPDIDSAVTDLVG